MAMNNGYGGVGVSTVVDVQGFNYNDGQDRRVSHKGDIRRQPMIGTETASTRRDAWDLCVTTIQGAWAT